ncbi:LysM peptidoglycan-binding domain-containing protein [Campylobacter ureolyticus]|uniref:LysM peptidoglycan-binding domain-containing protein n=1 Tax=Campylobacter ureolyticus TaxID=827 RepID=UPI0022B4CE75|nr:LysM peptidoglycan-binding domain-containing protein [Campylobacter ureolyticus]MCZ6155906.1 LysM peptidoglycan-binding domain-containing protein [Campylobacter ureolyticus]
MKKINFNYEKFSQGWSKLDPKIRATVANYRGVGDAYISSDELRLIHDVSRNEREERGLISSVLLNRLGFKEFDSLGSYFGGVDDVYAIRQKIGDEYRNEKAKRNQINPFSWNFQKASEFKFEQIGDTQGIIDTLVQGDLKRIKENPELNEWIFMKMDKIAPKDQEKALETLVKSHYISVYQKSFTPENQAKVAENSQIKPVYEFFGSGIKHQNSNNFIENINYIMRDENLKYANLIVEEQQDMDELKNLNLNIDDTRENVVQGAMNLNSPREEPIIIEKVKPADEPKIDYDHIFENAGINTRPYKIKDEKITENNLKSIISEHNFNRLCDEFSKTNASESDKKAIENLKNKVYPKKAEYTIQRGENLTYIARKFNTSIDAIMQENPQIKDKNLIYAGQKLNLPTGIEVTKVKENTKMNMSPTSEIQHQTTIQDKAIEEPKKEVKQTRKLTSQEKEEMLREFVEKKSSKSYRSSINRLFGASGDGVNRELMLSGKYNIFGFEKFKEELENIEKEVEKVDIKVDVMGF